MGDTDSSKQEETETKPVVEKQDNLPKFEKEQSNKITEKFGSKTEIVHRIQTATMFIGCQTEIVHWI